MIEMQHLPSFIDLHAHKDAAMEFTIVMASMPTENCHQPADWPMLTDDDLLLVQVSNDESTVEFSSLVPSLLVGEYNVEGVIVGDDRAWIRATRHIISRNDVEALVDRSTSLAEAPTYAMILKPLLHRMP